MREGAVDSVFEHIVGFEVVLNNAESYSVFLTYPDGSVEERMFYISRNGELNYSDY